MQALGRHADVVHRNDVRMRECREHARFLQEALGIDRVLRQLRIEHLERYFAVQQHLGAAQHCSHAATTDLTADAVPRNRDHAPLAVACGILSKPIGALRRFHLIPT